MSKRVLGAIITAIFLLTLLGCGSNTALKDSTTQAVQNTEMWNKVIVSYIATIKNMGQSAGDGLHRHQTRDESLPLSTIPGSPIVSFWNQNDSKYLTGYMGKRVVDNIELIEIKNRNKIDANTIEITTNERWTVCGKQLTFYPIYIMKLGSNNEWRIYDIKAQEFYDQIYSAIQYEVEIGNKKLLENRDRELAAAKAKNNPEWVYVNRDGTGSTYVAPNTILYNQDRSKLAFLMMLVFEQPTPKNIKRVSLMTVVDVNKNPFRVSYIGTTAYDPQGKVLMDRVADNPQWESVNYGDLLWTTIQYCLAHPQN